MRVKWEKMKVPTMDEKNAWKVWTTMAWATYDGDVPVMIALRSILRWRTTTWWWNRSAWRNEDGPCGGGPKPTRVEGNSVGRCVFSVKTMRIPIHRRKKGARGVKEEEEDEEAIDLHDHVGELCINSFKLHF